jgi:hypothetical protein
MAAAGLMMLGISTVIAVTGGFKGSKTSVSKPSLMVASNSPVAVATSSPEVPAVSVELNRPQSNENEIGAQKMSVASPASDSVRLHPNQRVRVTTSDLSDEPQSTLVANRASEANIRASEANTRASESNTSDIVNRKAQSVDVVMQIENGRVLQASIANPRKGMDGYEAMALRIARQRRYPAKKKGQETVKIQISPLD